MDSTDSSASTPNTETSGVDSPSSATSIENDAEDERHDSDSDASGTSGNTVRGRAERLGCLSAQKQSGTLAVPSTKPRTPSPSAGSQRSFEETEFVEIDDGVVVPRTVRRRPPPKVADRKTMRDARTAEPWNPRSYGRHKLTSSCLIERFQTLRNRYWASSS